MNLGILALNSYIPTSRLQRAEIAKAHAWLNPSLNSLANGERSVANWDEDSITMAVEASRSCLFSYNDTSKISGLIMASTSFPFIDRLNAGVVADALAMPDDVMTLDIASSQRAGTSALIGALKMTGRDGPSTMVTASENRKTKAASTFELTYGDAAASVVVGEGDVLATCLGYHSLSVDFVDHFRSEENNFDYSWEERWIRDEGVMKIVPQCINSLLSKTNIDASKINHFIFPSSDSRVSKSLAKKLGIDTSSVVDNLQSQMGNAGAAHPLIMLNSICERASPGDIILLTSFGQGADAILFQVTEKIKKYAFGRTVSDQLNHYFKDNNYMRFVTQNGLLKTEMGIRSEVDKSTGLSTHYRNKDMTQRMIGGACTSCGTLQFPKSNICVNPNCGYIGTQVDHNFSQKSAKVNSFTVDRLTFSPDPPAYYGMIIFDEGGRLMADFTDIRPDTDLEVGMSMRMVFRVKDFDYNRGFRRYFWKASPQH